MNVAEINPLSLPSLPQPQSDAIYRIAPPFTSLWKELVSRTSVGQ